MGERGVRGRNEQQCWISGARFSEWYFNGRDESRYESGAWGVVFERGDEQVHGSSALVKRPGANPPLAGGGSVEVDAAVLHALIEGGEVDTGVGYGIAEQHQVERATGGAGSVPDLEEPRSVGAGKIDGLAIWRPWRLTGGRKYGDFAVFNKQLNPAFPFHNPSVRHSCAFRKP
jgi:hypothetical protein